MNLRAHLKLAETSRKLNYSLSTFSKFAHLSLLRNSSPAMALTHFIFELRRALSTEACVLSDPSNEDFRLALLRWSDVDVKVPGAIVQVSNESDAVTTASPHALQ